MVECPCGCGQSMPEPVNLQPDLERYLEDWLALQGLSLAELRGRDRTRSMVEVRRRAAAYLRSHDWSLPRIGRFLERDHTTVLYLLRKAA